MVARFWWATVFGRPEGSEDDASIAAVAASGADVIDALKALKMRNMAVRDTATTTVLREMTSRPNCRASQAYAPSIASGGLTPVEAALALQGVIFHTGTVQLTDALTHLMLALAQHGTTGSAGASGAGASGWERAAREASAEGTSAVFSDVSSAPDAGAGDPGQRFLERAMHEALRVWPLFGVAHRIADRDIPIPTPGNDDGGVASAAPAGVIPAGTVLCFNYTALHSTGVADAGRFDPDRWLTLRGKDLPGYVPFGVPRNRPCPAQRLRLSSVPVFIQALARGLHVWSSAEHTRSLPGRGLAVVQLRLPQQPPQVPPAGLLASVRAVDLADGLRLSLTQLFCGTLLVLQSRAAAIAFNYHTKHVTPRGAPVPDKQR